jgi:hypothetical protein
MANFSSQNVLGGVGGHLRLGVGDRGGAVSWPIFYHSLCSEGLAVI